MKNYSKKITGIVLIFVALSSGLSDAKVRAIKARRDFEQSLAKKTITVALFYEGPKESRRGHNASKSLTRMYDDLSSYQPYDDADIIFLKVNTGRQELAELASLYGVTNIPTFIFFNNGKRIVDERGRVVTLSGSITRADLQNVIDTYLGADIDRLVAQKKERNKQILASENESWKPYFYPRDVFVRDYSPAETKENLE